MIFVFIVYLKQTFLGTTKFDGNKKIWWDAAPECPSWGAGLGIL